MAPVPVLCLLLYVFRPLQERLRPKLAANALAHALPPSFPRPQRPVPSTLPNQSHSSSLWPMESFLHPQGRPQNVALWPMQKPYRRPFTAHRSPSPLPLLSLTEYGRKQKAFVRAATSFCSLYPLACRATPGGYRQTNPPSFHPLLPSHLSIF